jgi:hypothetical protein
VNFSHIPKFEILGCDRRLPIDTFQVEVVGELVAEFQMLVERRSRLERPSARICDLLLGLPPDRARLVDHLDKSTEQLGAELAARRELNAEPVALWTSAARIRHLVLDNVNGPFSLAASLPMLAELLEDRVDTTAANVGRWGTQSMLVTALSHFPELESVVELLWFGRNMVWMEDRLDALWILARLALELLASYVLPSVTHNPPDGMGE